MSQSKQTANLLLSFQHDLEALLQVAPSLIVVFEPDGGILAANDEAARIIHVSYGGRLVGRNIFTIFQFADGSFDAQVLQVTRSQRMSVFEGIHNGRMLSCTLYPILDDRQKIIRLALLAQDHTDRRRAEDQVRGLTHELERKVLQRTAELRRANQQLWQEKRRAELLADFSKVLVLYAHDYPALLQHTSDEIAHQIGDACLIVVFSEDGTELQLTSVSHRSAAAREEMRTALNKKNYPTEQVGLARFMLQKEEYLAEQLSYEQVCGLIPPDLWPVISKGGFKALVGIPLLLDTRVLGAIFLARHRRESRPYSPDDVALLHSITGPLALTIENARLFEETLQSRQKLHRLSQKLVNMQEEQCQRIGRELHARIGQDLTEIHINLSMIENMLPDQLPDGVKPRLGDANRLVAESVAHMRNIISDFLPPMLERYGLTEALCWYMKKFMTSTKITVLVHDHNPYDLRLPRLVELGFFRIAQEALNNVARHAQATKVEIEIKDEGELLSMTIADNGVGFDTKEVQNGGDEHWGLFIMMERAKAIGASFDVKSLSGQGSRITLRAAATSEKNSPVDPTNLKRG